MSKIGIFYGSSTHSTARAAQMIAKALGVADEDVHDVARVAPTTVADYDLMVMGTSTWEGGSMQPDWYDFAAGVAAMDLEGKRIAFFGTGDESMADTFCDGVGELAHSLRDTQATPIGRFDTQGLHFHHSKAVGDDGLAVGLLLDDVNHPELTAERIGRWCTSLLLEQDEVK